MSERFDIYDEALKHIGVKERAAVHRDGDWHQVFHCWVIGCAEEGEPFVILQKRANDRDYPGKIDISAAGHLEAGESVADGVREIREELGLDINFADLIPLGRRVGIAKDGDFIDRQICHVFFLRCDQPLCDYRYPGGEVAGLLKLDIQAGLRLLSGEADMIQAEATGLGAAAISVGRGDFISSIDNYNLKALLLAQRYFAGQRQLWI